MATNRVVSETETVYVAGTDQRDAEQRQGWGYAKDTAREAYDSVGYYGLQDDTYEVYEFVTTTRIAKVEPPYNQ